MLYVYANPCFVTPWWESKARESSVKPCAQCMVQLAFSWIGHWILAMILFVFLWFFVQLVSNFYQV